MRQASAKAMALAEDLPESLRHNPCAGALLLLDALQGGRVGPVALQAPLRSEAGGSWFVDLDFTGGGLDFAGGGDPAQSGPT